MSARQADPLSDAILDQLGVFLRASSKASEETLMTRNELAKARDLRADIRRLNGSRWLPLARRFGRIFSWFERAVSIFATHSGPARNLPARDDAAMTPEGSGAFAADYAIFDRLSILYGGLFRSSVIINYILGVVAVGMTVISILPQPRFIAQYSIPFFPSFSHFATAIELLCIMSIGAIFCYAQTPHREQEGELSSSRHRGLKRLVAHRWHERWLEYRVLAERFRYLELMLSLSPGAATLPPFAFAQPQLSWCDRYFVWRTWEAKPAAITVREYRDQALALMVEQIEHHDASSSRRGAVARRLHKVATWLFFSSLFLCGADLVAESYGSLFFDANVRPFVLFGALLAPTVAAAIHGVLATIEYTKVAESSRETANRIASLVRTIEEFPASGKPAIPEALTPIRDAVTAFADAAISEASNWRALLHDKNVPLV
jgi:hypothetical protein